MCDMYKSVSIIILTLFFAHLSKYFCILRMRTMLIFSYPVVKIIYASISIASLTFVDISFSLQYHCLIYQVVLPEPP